MYTQILDLSKIVSVFGKNQNVIGTIVLHVLVAKRCLGILIFFFKSYMKHVTGQ